MPKKKKILIAISNMEFGGSQRQVVELVNNLNSDQFEVHVCSLSSYVPLAQFFNEGITLHIIEKKSKFDLSVVLKLRKLIQKHQFSVVHGYLFDAEIATRLAGVLAFNKVKVIGSERNADYILKNIQRKVYKLTGSLVDAVIANSQAGADCNARQTGLAKAKFHVIYNGVDTERFIKRDKLQAREQLNLPQHSKIIGMFASFKQQKNHPFLIAALAKLKDTNPEFKVLLVGDMLHGGLHGSDDYCSGVKQQIIDEGLAEHVIYLGNCDNVEFVYPACDFTVLPSLFEGTPNVVLESMACAVPTIATRVSDNDKIIDHETTGYIVDVEDVDGLAFYIDKLLKDDATLEKLSHKARVTMEQRFSSVKLAENTASVYLA